MISMSLFSMKVTLEDVTGRGTEGAGQPQHPSASLCRPPCPPRGRVGDIPHRLSAAPLID